MIPSRALRNAAMALLAADTATLAPAADAIYMSLVKEPFNATEDLAFADITLADFPGYADIAIVLAGQQEAYQPGTDDSVIDLLPPSGGFRWETTGAVDPAQTIHGYVVLNHAKDTILASQVFETPIVLTLTAQRVDGLDATLTLPKDSIF